MPRKLSANEAINARSFGIDVPAAAPSAANEKANGSSIIIQEFF